MSRSTGARRRHRLGREQKATRAILLEIHGGGQGGLGAEDRRRCGLRCTSAARRPELKARAVRIGGDHQGTGHGGRATATETRVVAKAEQLRAWSKNMKTEITSRQRATARTCSTGLR